MAIVNDEDEYLGTISLKNINEIDKYNFRYVLAESLPGRFTPTSAGANIADTVIEMIKEDKNE